MHRVRLSDDECPIARALDVVGDWWSLLILRDSLDGATRFDQFEQNLGISPTMLTRRLRSLVEHGLLQRHRYQRRPDRYEYLPTERAHRLHTVLVTLGEWADDGRPLEQRSVHLVDRRTGRPVEPVLVDRRTGEPITTETTRFEASPAASEGLRARYRDLCERSSEDEAQRLHA